MATNNHAPQPAPSWQLIDIEMPIPSTATGLASAALKRRSRASTAQCLIPRFIRQCRRIVDDLHRSVECPLLADTCPLGTMFMAPSQQFITHPRGCSRTIIRGVRELPKCARTPRYGAATHRPHGAALTCPLFAEPHALRIEGGLSGYT